MFAFPADAKVRFCKHVYTTDSGIFVCSRRPLAKKHIRAINRKFDRSLELLPRFVSKWGYRKASLTKRLDIYVISKGLMNDSSLFGDKYKNENVLARYIMGKGYLFLSYGALRPNSTDLPHELAHWYNDNLGISSELKDERMAEAFEGFYKKHAR